MLARACRQVPLLGPALATSWLIAVLCWFAEDNGVMVPAFGAPFVLPLVIAIVCAPAVVTGPPDLPGPPSSPAAPAAPGTPASAGAGRGASQTDPAAGGTHAVSGTQAADGTHAPDVGTASGGQPGYR